MKRAGSGFSPICQKGNILNCFDMKYIDAEKLIAYIERQKEQKPVTINQDEKEFLADEITAFLCNYDKEFDGEDPVPSEVAEHFYLLGKQAQEQKPLEWSEEDETCLTNTLIMLKEYAIHHYSKDDVNKSVNWLENRVKSLRPQPKDRIYQATKHDLAIRFMNYLDENRPEGKMSLSNGECEDIDKAFKENDWTKIIQYAKKYLIQSEQKPAEWSEDIIRKGIKEVGLTQYQINWLKNNVFPSKENPKGGSK